MQLSQHDKTEFQAIWQKVYGCQISFELAEELGASLIKLLNTIGPPVEEEM